MITGILIIPYCRLSEGGRVVKAVRFYQLAGDVNRTAAILDRALWRCSTALVRMSDVLTHHNNAHSNVHNGNNNNVVDFLFLIPRGLKMLPVHPTGPAVTGESILADYWDMRHYTESQPAVTPHADLSGAVQAIGEDHLVLESYLLLPFSYHHYCLAGWLSIFMTFLT